MKIILHIGLGKTGTSSIQETLQNNINKLKENGILYLGIMFENAPIKLFPWQRRGGTTEFYATDRPEDQLLDLIRRISSEVDSKKFQTVVISNEWFSGSDYEFKRNEPVANAFLKLQSEGHDITVVAYIRDSVSWAISAYQQWGIKHKTTLAEIQSFREYTTSRPPRFSETLAFWGKHTSQLKIHNYHSVGDVTQHFLRHYCNSSKIETINSNIQPESSELFLRACINQATGNNREVSPREFEDIFSRLDSSANRNGFAEWYNNLLPTNDDIKYLHSLIESDVLQINRMLEENLEPSLSLPDNQQALSKLKSLDLREVIDYLVNRLLALSKSNLELREKIRKHKK